MTDLRSAVATHGGLCAISDLAARWDTSKQWVRVLARRDNFPAPIVTEGGRELWPADEADAWFVAHEASVVERREAAKRAMPPEDPTSPFARQLR